MKLILFFTLLTSLTCAHAENFYQVSLLRAEPGALPRLIDMVEQRQARHEMIIMRHSQGDHWDLMLLLPATKELSKPFSYQGRSDFQHDFLVTSDDDWASIKKAAHQVNLFHIEMFQAKSGLYGDLLKQRIMENNYLQMTKRQPNMIFETYFGSDVDLFTLGFYADMPAFAAEPDLPAQAFEKAATDAGFASRSDIGFYLRKFLVGHNDTLATQVGSINAE